MLNNYLLIAVVIILVWLATFGAYLWVSRKQQNVEQEIEHLNEMLNNDQ